MVGVLPAGVLSLAARVFLILALLLTWTVRCQAGAFDTLRDDVRPGPSAPKPKKSDDDDDDDDDHHHHHDHCWDDDCDDDDDDGFGELLIYAAGVAITSPVWGPHVLMKDDLDTTGYFPRHPYALGVTGYMMIDPWLPAEPRTWSARLRAEYGDDLDVLSNIGGHVLIDTSSRLGIDTEWNYRRETLISGHDDLWMGDANLVFRFAQCEHAQMRIGGGFNWFADQYGSDFGYNFTYGGDLFPIKPVVLSSTIDWGTLGGADLFHFRLTGGVVFHGVETYVGFDYLDMDRTQIDSLIAGVRFWF